MSDDVKSDGLGCLWKWNPSKLFIGPIIKIVATLHIASSWPFHFLLVKCVLKCGVDLAWQRTSASLNYECFHDH